jgi:putative ABC transport system permease protein
MPAETAKVTKIRLQPVTDIHLHSNLIFDTANGEITNVYLFSAIAVLILLIASVNFMNLATAVSLKRSKEVGVKKVLGAGRKQLIAQFLGESLLTSLLAVIVAIGFIELLLPVFNQLAQKTLTIHYLGSDSVIPGMLVLAVFLGFFSGSYPAFFLSAFVPVKVLKGTPGASSSHSGSKAGLRKTLIVFQFAISIVLVIGTGVVYQQLDYVRHKKLGFDKEQMVWFRLPTYREDINYDAFRDKLLQNPGVQMVARTSGLPDGFMVRHGYRSEGMSTEDVSMLPTFSVDEQYFDLLGLEIVAGRKFSQDFISDTTAFILNESAAAHFGWSDPQAAIGQNLHREDGKDGRVIGVMKNFNHASLRKKIEPLILNVDPATLGLVLVKLKPGSIPETLNFLESTFREFFPSQAYEFSFLEDSLNNLYRAEMQQGKIFGYFSFLAIFIACLGLFGLSSFSAEQRTKEIGVRKVLGASISSIILLLSKEFTRLVAIAFIIGCPLAYYLMNNWLSDFAYRINLTPPIFLLAGALALLIALVSVSYNAIKAALANPVESLRYE